MAVNFVQPNDQFKITKSINGYKATLVFIKNPDDGTLKGMSRYTSIPELGDTLPVERWKDLDQGLGSEEVPELKATSISAIIMDATQDKQKYIVEYTTEKANDEYTEDSLRISGEWATLEGDGTNAMKFVNSESQVEGFFKQWIMTAEYSVSKYFSATDTYTGLENASYYTSVGGSKYYFTGIAGAILPVSSWDTSETSDGVWLCRGCDIQQIVDRQGEPKYKRTEEYSYKYMYGKNIAPNAATGTGEGGWNLVYNRSVGGWDYTNPQTYAAVSSSDWPREMPDIGPY